MLLPVALVAACAASSACALTTKAGVGQHRVSADEGIPVCATGADRDLLSSEALQCWFSASHGQWRTLNHQSHLEALVVDVEARDLRDAIEIAQRLVADPIASSFTEILVYVARQQGSELRIRRVRWTGGRNYETLEFSSPAAESPLTVRSSPNHKPSH